MTDKLGDRPAFPYDEKTTLREQALLSAQLFAMINYSAILGERIGVWR